LQPWEAMYLTIYQRALTGQILNI